MKNNLILFSSVTHAIRSRDLLNKYGFNARMIRTPANLREYSCGYSLLVMYDFDKAVNIIRNNGIAVLRTAAVDFK